MTLANLKEKCPDTHGPVEHALLKVRLHRVPTCIGFDRCTSGTVRGVARSAGPDRVGGDGSGWCSPTRGARKSCRVQRTRPPPWCPASPCWRTFKCARLASRFHARAQPLTLLSRLVVTEPDADLERHPPPRPAALHPASPAPPLGSGVSLSPSPSHPAEGTRCTQELAGGAGRGERAAAHGAGGGGAVPARRGGGGRAPAAASRARAEETENARRSWRCVATPHRRR